MSKEQNILLQIRNGDRKALARAISFVENEQGDYENILRSLHFSQVTPVVGITGPPGAGKSSIINSLTELLTAKGKKTAIIAIDPTSPFNYGSLLGDRLRMSPHFDNPNVFIRSV